MPFVRILICTTGDVESPAVYAWVLHFLAQHLDLTKQHQQALTIIDEAIKHTPTLLELYMVKAKILKVCCIDSSFFQFLFSISAHLQCSILGHTAKQLRRLTTRGLWTQLTATSTPSASSTSCELA